MVTCDGWRLRAWRNRGEKRLALSGSRVEKEGDKRTYTACIWAICNRYRFASCVWRFKTHRPWLGDFPRVSWIEAWMGSISSAWDIREQGWKHLRQRRGAGLRARHSGRRAASDKPCGSWSEGTRSLARSGTVTKQNTYSDQVRSRGPEESELVELWRTCPARQDALFSCFGLARPICSPAAASLKSICIVLPSRKS